MKNLIKEKEVMYKDIHKNANRMTVGSVCLFGNTGAGKSLYFGWLATKQLQKIIFLTKSWTQAEEKAKFFESLGLDVQLAKSKTQLLKAQGLDLSVYKVKKTCPFASAVLVHDFSKDDEEIFKNTKPDQFDFSKQIIVTVFANIDSLRGLDLSEWTVVFDDPEYTDIKTLIKFNPSEWTIAPQFDVAKIRGKDVVFAHRPADMYLTYRILAGKVYFTTAEFHVKKILETKYFVHTVNISHRETEHNIVVVSTEMTRKKKQDTLLSVWYSAYKHRHKEVDWTLIGDGIGAELTHTSMKGRNNLSDQNILVEMSFENQVILEEMYCLLAPNRTTDDKSEFAKIFRALHTLILVDKFHQVVGRNQGNRSTGKFTVVLIDKLLAKQVTEMCNFENVPYLKDSEFRSKSLVTKRFGRQDFLLELGSYLYNKAEYIYQQKHFFKKAISSGTRLTRKQLVDSFRSLFDEQAKLANGRSEGVHFDIAACLFELADLADK